MSVPLTTTTLTYWLTSPPISTRAGNITVTWTSVSTPWVYRATAVATPPGLLISAATSAVIATPGRENSPITGENTRSNRIIAPDAFNIYIRA